MPTQCRQGAVRPCHHLWQSPIHRERDCLLLHRRYQRDLHPVPRRRCLGSHRPLHRKAPLSGEVCKQGLFECDTTAAGKKRLRLLKQPPAWIRIRLRIGTRQVESKLDWNDTAILSLEDGTKQCQRNAMMTTNHVLLLSSTLAVTLFLLSCCVLMF